VRSKAMPNMEPKEWLLLAIAAAGDAGLSPIQLQRSLFLLSQKRKTHVGPGFYAFEQGDAWPFSKALYEDLDAFVAAGDVVKEYRPEATRSVFRLANAGRSLAEELRPQVKPEAFSYLEEAVAWVTEQSTLDLFHKTPTIRVVG
jgi:hypothetical protein